MKRIEIVVPEKHADAVEEVLQEYSDDITSSEVEREDKKALEFQVFVDSEDIDGLTAGVKDISEIESGDLVIRIADEAAVIEKGKRREGGTSTISVQEMYTKAFEFASFGPPTWILIALGAGIAVFGAIMENIMVVVGSMVITPMLGPYIAASFGIVIGDRKVIEDSAFSATLSLLLAVSSAFIIALVFPIQINSLILLIADAGFATIPLSLFVGAAAALTFMTESREALAGVAVAIALVPPAAVVGIALSQLNVDLLFDVSLVLVSNVTALILAGSVTFKLMGVTPSTYYRQKVSEEKLRKAIIVSVGILLVIGGIVAFFSYQDFRDSLAETETERYIDETFGERVLMQEVEILRHPFHLHAHGITIRLAVVDPEISRTQIEDAVAERTGRDITVKLIAIEGQVQGG